MVTFYNVLKYLHILLAIVAVGFNASYAIWITRASRQPDHLGYVLRGIKFLDDRIANPGYALLLVTGLTLVAVGHWPLTTFWISTALVLWFVTLILGLGFYTPALRQQISALETNGPESAAYRQWARRSTILGIVVAIPVLLIVFLMVVKPG